MANPTNRDVHLDAILSNVSIKYANGLAIADQVFPRVKVLKESDKYFTYTRDFRIPRTYRAIGSESNAIDWNISTDSYFCEEYALHDDVFDRIRKNADTPLNLDVDTTETITDALIRDREKRVADIAFSTGSITTNSALTGSDQWSDYAGSDPLGDLETAMLAVKQASGRVPNTVVLGEQVMSKLRNHPDLLERIKYTQKGVVTADLLASLLPGNPRVLVGDLMYDSSQEGDSESLGYIWGKKALVAYVEASPGLRKMSLGYQFYSQDRTTSKWREDKIKADRIEVSEVSDEKLVSASCGYLLDTVVA
jgi:hypothetical protein